MGEAGARGRTECMERTSWQCGMLCSREGLWFETSLSQQASGLFNSNGAMKLIECIFFCSRCGQQHCAVLFFNRGKCFGVTIRMFVDNHIQISQIIFLINSYVITIILYQNKSFHQSRFGVSAEASKPNVP